MRAEMGAAINPVTWTPVSTGYGLPTGLRSEQACLRCACLVVDLARLRVRRAGSCVAEVGPGARTSPRSEPLRRNMGRAGIGILDGFPHLGAIMNSVLSLTDAAHGYRRKDSAAEIRAGER